MDSVEFENVCVCVPFVLFQVESESILNSAEQLLVFVLVLLLIYSTHMHTHTVCCDGIVKGHIKHVYFCWIHDNIMLGC